MLLKVYPENPAPRHLNMILDVLKNDGVIIYPTDTVYAIGCDMKNQKAIDKLCQIIGKKQEEANLSLICHDLSNLSEYTVPFDNRIYKFMRKTLPGPYTYILKANNKVPKLFKSKSKKTIGIRVPDNNIPREIVRELGNPIVTASIHNGTSTTYYTDPELIYESFKNRVDLVIDGGTGEQEVSTIIDASNGEVEVVREGKGAVELFA
jgi:tRNA threonylcarbamoyl adenosine modification protein (Sua5/YciO/YrdC/YwlC family)